MKRLKHLYLFPIAGSLLAAALLIWYWAPAGFYIKAILMVLIPLLILAVGFRIITYQRIQIIRNQLYQIFHRLEEFDVDEPQKVAFEKSPFPIFNELNEYLIELINRIRSDYQANKQFTQNASHELQTPLAIIKGHVELLLQSPNIGEKEIESLAAVLQNTNRLSKLNSALILLSKIEHQRFVDTEMVDFEKLTDDLLQNFYDLIKIQGIRVYKKNAASFVVEMSVTLAEILVANLLQNAIRHNIENGSIDINIEARSFTITNSGNPLKESPDNLFKRFKRSTNVEESLGLGLSIAKRICDQSGLDISYLQEGGEHSLRIQRRS